MKKFDLAAAKKGAKVCTRDGRDARILCFNSGGVGYNEVPLPIIAEVFSERGSSPNAYRETGRIDGTRETCYDLMIADDNYLEKLERGEYPPVAWEVPSPEPTTAANTFPSDITDPWDEFKRQAAIAMIQTFGRDVGLNGIKGIIDKVNTLVEGLKSK